MRATYFWDARRKTYQYHFVLTDEDLNMMEVNKRDMIMEPGMKRQSTPPEGIDFSDMIGDVARAIGEAWFEAREDDDTPGWQDAHD